MRWPEEPQHSIYLLDPCAGDGEAIVTLRDLWVRQWVPDVEERRYYRSSLDIHACELEAERADALGKWLSSYRDKAHHGDAFLLHPGERADRATVLFLNPPYDQDPEHGRLEQRFLARFTELLHPGSGILLFVVPAHALAASADHLARCLLDVRAWRFPREDFEAFGQVVLVARRAAKPLTDLSSAEEIRRWAKDPALLPELPEVCPEPLTVDLTPDPHYSLSLSLEELDVTAALSGFRPLADEAVGLGDDPAALLGAKFQTAVPPKPAHIALALSSGMFNGWPLTANDPHRHPPLLAKGVFEREHLVVSEKTDKEGRVTGIVEIEQPKLRLTVLRLDDMSFHELAAGTVPTGADDVAKWNAADLIECYDGSLARLLGQQFPALHDPTDPEHAIKLPPLARTPYRIQSQAIQASLKLLATRRNPMLVAEVGTGKTTMALSVAAALSPEHYEDTVTELQRVGIPDRPPHVEKTLAVCPPHLLDTWTEEAAAVVPEWRVQVVKAIEDLGRDAELYVLSRETAKLGHAVEGVGGSCPKCGALLETRSQANASRRLRCQATLRRPVNRTARRAELLAAILLPAAPDKALLRSLVRSPLLLERYGKDAEGRPVARNVLESFTWSLARELGALAEAQSSTESFQPVGAHDLAQALEPLASELGVERGIVTLLAEKSRGIPWLEGPIESLRRSVVADVSPEHTAPSISGLLRTVERLHKEGEWTEEGTCNEPLFQARPHPRRVPLAEIIQRYHRRDFDLVLLDEAHEYSHAGSAQTKAAHRLSGLPGVSTLVLTGSLMGGYASSLFTNFWHLSPLFRKEFDRTDRSGFIHRYGYRKTLREPETDEPSSGRRGRYTDRDVDGRTTLGEAPGVMPTFILRHLLPTSVLVHKDDLDCELPTLTEVPESLEPDPEDEHDEALLAEYKRIEAKVLACVRKDRFSSDRSGRLLGALVELPSYLDRSTDDLPPFEVRYPEALGGELVARARSFPASWKTPKERWLLAELGRQLARGQKVLVFLRHTGTAHLPERLMGLIREVTPRVAWLDAGKVPTHKRQGWIDRHVLGKDVQVLLVNPNAVRTGLNNLVSFSTALWYQLDWSATTYRQANGRIHRIGQTKPVTVKIPYYAETSQEVAFDLVAKKVGASLQVDGLDLQAALEAAGASSDRTAALATAMSLGQAIYEALTGKPRRRPPAPKPPKLVHQAPAGKPIRRTTSSGVQLSLL